jgi:hypothetical protein
VLVSKSYGSKKRRHCEAPRTAAPSAPRGAAPGAGRRASRGDAATPGSQSGVCFAEPVLGRGNAATRGLAVTGRF